MTRCFLQNLHFFLKFAGRVFETPGLWCALNNCFCHQKAEMNFTQSNLKNMDNFKLIFSSYGTVFAHTVTRFDILYQLLPYFQNF